MIQQNNYEWMKEEIKKYRKLIPGSDFLCMFSGGKDSGLALSMAMKKSKPIALVHITENDSSLYHGQEIKVIEAQAHALNIPVFYMSYKWWRNWQLAYHDLNKFQKIGAQSIVFGDIRLKYIFKGDIPLCKGAGYKACLPIGGVLYDDLMDEIEKHQIVSIITKINHPAISSSMLGKPFTRDVYLYFKDLGIDPFGELDEFHTTLVNADCFLYPLQYHLVPQNEKMISVIVDS